MKKEMKGKKEEHKGKSNPHAHLDAQMKAEHKIKAPIMSSSAPMMNSPMGGAPMSPMNNSMPEPEA